MTPETPPKPSPNRWLQLLTSLVLGGLIAGYLAAWSGVGSTLLPPADNWLLLLVGAGGATIANSTGVGGGVVFLPTFEFLDKQGLVTILPAQIVAMSFIIQSFGMTTGSITWLNRIYHDKHPDTGISANSFFKLIGIVLLTSLPTLLVAQALFDAPPKMVLFYFKTISIGLGLTLLTTTILSGDRPMVRRKAERLDTIMLAFLGALGGFATAFFSVGTGELVALYLFIRGFPLVTSAAVAVIVSAVSVLIGVAHHLSEGPQPWELLVFIIPGAVLGGFFANKFAYWLGTKRLKIFAALWITLSSIYMLWAQ